MVAAKAFASAATRGCGLKLEYAQPVDADFASAATRGCGLKRYEPVVNQSAESVSRHARLWIETSELSSWGRKNDCQPPRAAVD